MGTNFSPHDRSWGRKVLTAQFPLPDLPVANVDRIAGCKGPELPSLVHFDECKDVGFLACVFGVIQTFPQLLNTFMRLDEQGLRAGREKHLLRGHLGDYSKRKSVRRALVGRESINCADTDDSGPPT